MKYTVTVPPTAQMGSFKTVARSSRNESAAKNALWDYNSARAHDGLPPLSRMPSGTFYAPQYEYSIQGFYSGQWEEVTTEETRKEALDQLKCYRENESGTAFRMKRIPA